MREKNGIVGELVDGLFERNDLLVETQNTAGYRNKIAYTLAPSFFSLSPLALPVVNEFVFSFLFFLIFFIYFFFFFSYGN